jgi:uncharacterized protein YecE (DUF72 family)
MPTPRFHFGLPSLHGGLAGYSRSFDLLELRCDPAPPTAKHLARLRREAPPEFYFALVVGRSLADLTSSTSDATVVQATRRAAETLGARWLVIRTPASAGPSTRTRARLSRLVAELQGAAGGVAWEPRGVWTDEELVDVSGELGVSLVRDLAEHEAPPSSVVYTRLLALGRNSRIGSGAIERVAERLEGVEEAFIVIEGEGGAGVAKRLRASLGQMSSESDVELDDEATGEEADEDEDGLDADEDFDDQD